MSAGARRELLGRTGLSLAIRLGGIALNFLALLVLARVLDAGVLGLWAWAVELIALVCSVAGLGLNMIAVRVVPDCRIGQAQAQLRRFIGAGLVAGLIGSALAGLTLWLALSAGWLVAGIDAGMLALMVLVLACFTCLRFLQEVLRGAGRIVLAQIGEQLLWPLVLLCAALWFWLEPEGDDAVPVLLGAQLVLFALLSLCLGFASSRLADSAPLGDDQAGKQLCDWLAGGLPLALCAGLSVFLRRGDLIMLGVLGDARDVAFYNPASRYASLLVLGQAAASMAAAGRLRDLWRAQDMAGLQHWLDHMAAISVLFSVPLCALFWLFPDALLGLFGAEYGAAALVLQMLTAAQLVNCWTGPVAALVVAAGLERVFTVATAASSALLLGLLVLLVPRWGMNGAALAGLVAVSALNLAMVAIIRQRTGLICWARPAALAGLALAPFAGLRMVRTR